MTQTYEPQALWPEEALQADGQNPTLTWYDAPPETATGASVVVCPGGGYAGHASHEGEPVAQWLNGLGIHAIVLHYRVAPHKHPAMLNDAARAVQTVRANAEAHNSDPNRIGILGFSAGGHLVSTLSTHFQAGDSNAADPIDRVSSRPDVAILIYPVIALLESYAHIGSRINLLGESPDPDLVASLCNETQVTSETPPSFLIHTVGDTGVPCENSLVYTLALQRCGVPFELHIYEKGEHGFGLGTDDPILSTWPERCAAWLHSHGF